KRPFCFWAILRMPPDQRPGEGASPYSSWRYTCSCIWAREAEMSDDRRRAPSEELLAHALDGDREAMAAFIFQYEDRIRRRLRGKLRPAARSIFDTQDVFAQVVASVDQYLVDSHLDVKHEEQLWKLIWTVGERIVWRQNELASRPCPAPPAGGQKAPAAIIEISDDLETAIGAARREDDREM